MGSLTYIEVLYVKQGCSYVRQKKPLAALKTSYQNIFVQQVFHTAKPLISKVSLHMNLPEEMLTNEIPLYQALVAAGL
jgi:hypothetical protein